jgi:hypothetical protein
VSRAAEDNQSFPVITSPVALRIFYEAPNTTRIQEGYDWRIGTVKKEKLNRLDLEKEPRLSGRGGAFFLNIPLIETQ